MDKVGTTSGDADWGLDEVDVDQVEDLNIEGLEHLDVESLSIDWRSILGESQGGSIGEVGDKTKETDGSGGEVQDKEEEQGASADPDKIRYNCSQCSYRSSRRANLMRHLKTHMKPVKDFKCEECERSFDYSSTLLRHFKTKHPDVPWKPPASGSQVNASIEENRDEKEATEDKTVQEGDEGKNLPLDERIKKAEARLDRDTRRAVEAVKARDQSKRDLLELLKQRGK